MDKIEKTDLLNGLNIARTYDVASPEDGVVVYSISFLPTKENREKAFNYVQKNPGKMMIEHTECGAKLVEMGYESVKTLNQEDIMFIWGEASRRFIASAKGDVTAFVDGADKRSVFRTVELPNILKNDNIKTINKIDKFKFAKQFEND